MKLRPRATAIDDFQEIYRRDHGFVWAVVRRFGVEGSATDDAVQDTFVTAFRRFGDFRGSSARPWLYGIARRIASKYRRASARAQRRNEALASATLVDSVRDGADREEVVVELDRAIASLPPRERELFFLSEVDGLTGPELAEALLLNPNTVYWRIRRLRHRLAEALSHDVPKVTGLVGDRPQPNERSWAALLPMLQAPATTPAALSPVAGWILAGGVTVSAAVGTTLAVAQPPSSPIERSMTPAPVLAATENHRRPEEPSASARVDPPQVPAAAKAPPVRSFPATREGSERSPTPPPPPPERRSSEPETGTGVSLAMWNARLHAAMQHLERGRPAAALDLLAAVDVAPSPPLGDLRVALRVEALCALGSVQEARERAHAFLQRRPSTAMRARIGRTCAGSTTGSLRDGELGE